MKIKVVTFASAVDGRLANLKKSFLKFGIDNHIIEGEWKGYGTKVIALKEYLKDLKGYTHFMFVDAYDTFFLDGLWRVESVYNKYYRGKILFSTEKACWPDWNLKDKYPENHSEWKYLNSGSFIAPVKEFLELIDKHSIEYLDDDQTYYTNIFLQEGIDLDYECRIFQSMAHRAEEDFALLTDKGIDQSYGILNRKLQTEPIVLHFNGRCEHPKYVELLDNITMNSLEEVKYEWKDTPEVHKLINDIFIQKVNSTSDLNQHRTFVEKNIHGFGERSFHYMWKLIIDKMPDSFTFLEIGVFRGQVLSLIELIAESQNKKTNRYGVTPLTPEEIGWESDYAADIERIHDEFTIKKDYKIIKGFSTDENVIEQANKRKYDIVYIDGGHKYDTVKSDIKYYLPMLKPGGYLVIDDCACKYAMPWGYFQGIEDVCRATDEILPPFTPNPQYEYLFNVVHNRIWKKINLES